MKKRVAVVAALFSVVIVVLLLCWRCQRKQTPPPPPKVAKVVTPAPAPAKQPAPLAKQVARPSPCGGKKKKKPKPKVVVRRKVVVTKEVTKPKPKERKPTPTQTQKVVTPETVPATGCVEIHLPALRQGDIGIKGFISGPEYDLVHDPCTGLKEGNGAFGPLPNTLCQEEPGAFCDFRYAENVTGHKIRLKFSFRAKPGVAYTLRLPRVVAEEKGYATALYLVRALLPKEQGTTEAYRQTVRFGEANPPGATVQPYCYRRGITVVYYDEKDVPPSAACLTYLNLPPPSWVGP